VLDEVVHREGIMARMPPVRLERDGDVAELILDAPPLNLFGEQLLAGLEEAIETCHASRPRALLVRAEGDVFSAGVDVHVFSGLDTEHAGALTTRLLELSHRVEALPLPTLAVAHGLCLTAGLELSLACDMLWAGEGVQFGLVEKVIGITPLMGGTQRIAERAGSARAREFVMTGNLYTAETLLDWGVVNRVLPGEQLLEKSRRFALRLAEGPTLAHAATKSVIRAQSDHGTRGADDRTADLTSHLFESRDSRRAVKSFLQNGPGKADFSGE
jgi:enoyl-CoA hydratase/carnithine racemase